MTPADLQGSIISHRNDRMGGRMIAMLNALRITRDYDLPFFVGWTTGGRTSEEMRDPTAIFDADWVAQHFFDGDVLGEVYDDLIDLSTLTQHTGWTPEKFRAAIAQGSSFLSGAAMGVTVLPWENPQEVAARLPLAVESIRFSAPVRAMIERIDSIFAGTKLTAYHIRRGDIIYDPITSNKLWPNKFIPREFYEQHLGRTLADPAARVLIFSDTPVEVERLRKVDPRVQGFDDLLGDTDLTPGARDFLELFAMSRCKNIYGPPSSAFSQTAMTIGGCSLQAVEDALSPQDRAAAMDRMTDRLEARSTLFINMGDVGQCLHFLIERQKELGDPARARRIIRAYMDDGLDKSFAYQLLCELSVTTGDLAACEDIRDLAYARPSYSDDSMATVNTYSALHHLAQGNTDTALDRLHAAFWFRPLENVVHGAVNLGLTADVVTPDNFYPFDPAMTRQKGNVFPQGRRALAELNTIAPKGYDPEGRSDFHMWDIVVRDWRLTCGKKLNRAFTNKSKIAKSLDMLERAFSKLDGSPALTSARGVLLFAAGDVDAALECQRRAIAAAPDTPLYRKRISDVLFSQGADKTALFQLRKASNLMGWHPTYQAELGWRLWRMKERDECWEIYNRLAVADHRFIEVHLMTSDMIRRNPDRLEESLAVLERGLKPAHGAQRLLAAKARLLMMLERVEEGRAVYEQLVDCGLGTEHTHVEIYRQFSALGREDIARELTARSIYDFDMVKEMAGG
ncbi:hypothetical protein AN189_09655 [Loktanella sp. 3ANDIMAR09]|uniref:hypothetical protein n=1 Tax=Loktanella sp. 3ANDIMAR09 TaxID=1225657 RepID=UPI000701D487|nr:hypothetical protein [Loktanella sp. 3ANDIMAR09]KQI68564.1 hypothetical protein AN189_09655 [Loktanella sp. 3ANDIMAR09]